MNTTNLNELAKEIHNTNVEKGFWKKPNNITTQRMLIASELYEAFEAHRKGVFVDKEIVAWLIENEKEPFFTKVFKDLIKDTFEDEIADTYIRLMDYGCWLGVDFNQEIVNNAYYNFEDNLIEDLDFLINYIQSQIRPIGDIMANVLHSFGLVQKFAKTHKIDLLTHVRLKVKYNKTRPYLHGKNY